MGLFGNDSEQDARLDAMESHLRAMSESIQQTQLDVMKTKISMIRLEAMLGDYLSRCGVGGMQAREVVDGQSLRCRRGRS